MKYLAAYLLLATAGKTPSADSVKQLFSSVGIEADEERLSSLISSLEGKNVEEVKYTKGNNNTYLDI
jgi:large subunit ribosomal protein LP2